LLDEALKNTELDANKANLYRTKARMFYKSGQDEKAIEAWRRALDLEARKPR
jgi:Tfp pilus assembly protein PilF